MSPAPMRIALISEHASPLAAAGSTDAGGQNVYVAHVARELAAVGHRVDVYTRRDDPAQAAVARPWHGVRVLHVDAGPPCFVPKEQLLPHMPAFADAMGRLLQERPPYDVLHANFFMSGWVGLALRLRFGVPLVTTFHALGLVRREHQRAADQFPPARIGIEQALALQSDRVIAECPQDADDLMRLYGAPPGRISTVPCGVDTTAFRPGDRAAARRRLGLPDARFIVLQLGRLVPRKGIATAIEAMALMQPEHRPRHGPATLVVVGGNGPLPDEAQTPEIARLRGVARANGVADRVHFVGRRDRADLRDWYLAADVFVTTPWYEPFGITPLEAMACGRPVIGSAVGGIRHTVADRLTGFLVPPKDPAAVAERLDQLRADPALAAQMGRAGTDRVRRQFTWTRVARQLQAVYADVAATRALPAVRPRPAADTPAAVVEAALSPLQAAMAGLPQLPQLPARPRLLHPLGQPLTGTAGS